MAAIIEEPATAGDVMLEVQNLVVEYRTPRGTVYAVSDISFDVRHGETLGLVGESGCGKSTTGRAVMMLNRPKSGSIRLNGVELTTLSARQLRDIRSDVHMIFQDPISSLNPRRKVRDIVVEGLGNANVPKPWHERLQRVLTDVQLNPDVFGDRRPYQLSGGQAQRVAIARALILEPSLVVCDEPVSALDVSIQAQILNLLEDMKQRYGLTLLFIAHDLAVVKNISDRIAVMYLGTICELAPSDALYSDPLHPYTHGLLEAIPIPDPDISLPPIELRGADLPSPLHPPSGCRFRTRCPRAESVCADERPLLREITPGHFVACHFPGPSASAPTPVAMPVAVNGQARADRRSL